MSIDQALADEFKKHDQETIELTYCKKHINGYIDEAIRTNPANEEKVQRGVEYLKEWLAQEYYDSKAKRLAQLDGLLLEELVRDVFTATAYCIQPTLYVNVTGQLAQKMGFDNHQDSITTVAEIVAILCYTNAYDIIKESTYASLQIENKLELPDDLIHAMEHSMFLPPIVCRPAEVTTNYESPYITFNEPLMLGTGNSHGGDLCLDVINLQNNVALTINEHFVATTMEEPGSELDTQEKLLAWNQFVQQSHEIYDLLIQQGNRFYFSHKPDKRGRLYTQGYHVNPQGTPYKKAMLELAHRELVEGVPG